MHDVNFAQEIIVEKRFNIKNKEKIIIYIFIIVVTLFFMFYLPYCKLKQVQNKVLEIKKVYKVQEKDEILYESYNEIYKNLKGKNSILPIIKTIFQYKPNDMDIISINYSNEIIYIKGETFNYALIGDFISSIEDAFKNYVILPDSIEKKEHKYIFLILISKVKK